jgi:hypothetical protein
MSGSSRSEDVEQELLLLLCGTDERRCAQAGRIRELAQAIDPERFLSVLAAQRLTELAGARLRVHASREAPRWVLDTTAEELAATRMRALGLEAATDYLLARLRSEGVRALALKGVRLARLLYDDPGLRAAGDIDLLVAPDDLAAAVATAVDLGYSPPGDPVDRHGLPALHFELLHPSLPPLELHWRIHWLEEEFSASLLSRAQPGHDGRLEASPADEAALLLAVFARDGFAGLRLAADIASWWDRFGARLPRGALTPLFAQYEALREVWTAAAWTAERTVGVPACELVPTPGCRRAARVAQRLANWSLTGDPDQVRANVMLIDGLLRPAGTRRDFLLEKVFPSSAILRYGYGLHGAHPAQLQFARLTHGARHLLRFGFALWSVRRGRFHAPLPRGARVA